MVRTRALLEPARRAFMRPPCRRPRPTGTVTLHEAKFPRLEETGQAALEVAQEEDAPPKTRAEAQEGLTPSQRRRWRPWLHPPKLRKAHGPRPAQARLAS